VCGQVESDTQPFLACGEVTPVEGVRFLGGGESCVLADCPWLPDVHGGVRTTNVRREPGHPVEMGNAFQVRRLVPPLRRDPLRGGNRWRGVPLRWWAGARQRPRQAREARDRAHHSRSSTRYMEPRSSTRSHPVYRNSLTPASRNDASCAPARPAWINND